MDESTRARRLEDLRRICREQGIPLTVQRRAILEAVLDLGDHPTAERVHEAVARTTPGVSRTTVYRTLEVLVALGLIDRACHAAPVVRYDGRTEHHHHLVCVRCDAIFDVSDERLDGLPLPDTSALGFRVTDCRVQLRGVCRPCLEKEGES